MKKTLWSLLLLVCLMVSPACALTSQFTSTPTPVPSDTPLPPTAIPPSPTPFVIIVTATLAPTQTPLPVPPTSTKPPRPTNTPGPTDTPVPTTAIVRMYNGLAKTINVTLSGPDQKKFTLASKAEKEFEVTPGLYSFTITATGFYPLTGSRTFGPGVNTWDIGKAKP